MKFTFNRLNVILLIVAIVTTLIGYVIMGSGDKSISVILLVIAYAILFPLSIVLGTKKNN